MQHYGFLTGGGEMGERTRLYDWAATSVGLPEHWPKSLRSTVATILSSRFPMFLWWGPDLIQFYNDAYRPSLGNEGKHPTALGQKGKDCWPEIWDIIFPLISQVLSTGEATWSEDQLVPIYRNGAIEDVYWTFGYSPVRDDEDNINGVLVICTETTQKVNYLQELTQSKKELEFAVDAADLGTWDLNPVTNKFTANARLKEWFGLQPGQEIELPLAIAVIHEEDRQRVSEAISRALQPESGGHYDIEYRIINPHTTIERIVRAKGKALFNEENQPFRFNGILQDITEQKMADHIERLARQKVEENEKNFRNTILGAPVAISIFKGPQFIVEIANERMFELWGKTPAEMLHRPLFEGLPEGRNQGFEEMLTNIFNTGITHTAQELPARLPRNGVIEQHYIDVLYEPERGAHGEITGIIAVAILVTERVKARRQIEELVAERTKELAEVNKNLERSNAELSQFAHIASHDLQEPIRKVVTYAGLLEDRCNGLDAQGKNFLQKIMTASHRMQVLIRDILTYSELSKPSPLFEPVSLQTVVHEVQTEFELLIQQKGAQLLYNELPIIDAIPLQVAQLFSNLVSNALKYTSPDRSPLITITACIEDAQVHIQVRDNGIGFEPQYAEGIFSIFQRLHRKDEYSGTGIGLAMCRKIAQNHYGTIYATSKLGEGSAFHVILPAHQTNE
ncbi:MAG: ATP-binding protein [Bacteroidota bacterium]